MIELHPGDSILIAVYGDPRYGAGVEGPVVYGLSTPISGQDDGWGGNLLIRMVDRYGGIGDPTLSELVAIGGIDEKIDFGDPEEDPQIWGQIIRVGERFQ